MDRMTHDSLCFQSQGKWDGGCQCHVIAKVDMKWHTMLWANNMALLENSDVILSRTHWVGQCNGEYCTIHNRSEHHMRSFPQQWRGDAGFMERICEHGVGHPDPDEIIDWPGHGCDGCCAPNTPPS